MSTRAASAPQVVVVCGPTASGKTELAVALAERFQGEVVNADSRQVYRGMDVGTAKPDVELRRRVEHHLFDLVEPAESFSAGTYRELALPVLERLAARGRLAILVGGTGLYLRALLEGLFEGPRQSERTHRRLEQVARRGGGQRLFRWLSRIDPEWAERVGPRDTQRILRGLDVYMQTGKPISSLIRASASRPGRLAVKKIGLAWPRETLYARIEERAERMLAAGFLEEVRRLLEDPGFPESNAAKALGYRSLISHLGARKSLSEACAEIKQDTRRLAKRQLTWFRRDAEIEWIDARDARAAQEVASAKVEAWLTHGGRSPGIT